MDRMKMESPDMTAQNVERIGTLFPNCVTETVDEDGKRKKAINFELLKQMLSPDVVDGDECYEFTWVGKKAAIVEANKPIRKTLRPCVEESKNWDTTENLYIEGDNLEVLKLLQESYLGKVKMIYIDPPYNTGNDFIYADDFMRSQEEENQQMGMYDENGDRLFKNTDTNGRFHSDWCSMIYSRLMLARNLLTEDGVIFSSIDENEANTLKFICDEVFGESNCIGIISNTNNPKGRSDDKYVATAHEYVLVYAKSIECLTWYGFEPTEEITRRYNKVDKDGKRYREIDLRKTGENDLREDRPNLFYYFYYCEKTGDLYPSREDVQMTGYIQIKPQREDGKEGNWRWSLETAEKQISGLVAKFMPTRKVWGVMQKDYLEGRALVKPTSSWTFKDVNSERGTEEFIGLGFDKRIFQKPKPLGTIKRCTKLCSKSNDDIVIDFFSGSATTAHAVMQLNAEDNGHRKFIMVQLPEKCDEKSEAYKAGYKNICEIGKERIRRAGEKIKSESPLTTQNLDVGFRVLKLDDTNMKDIYYAPDDYSQDLLARLESNIKEDRTDLDLLFGCLLDWGLPLAMPYSSEQIDGCIVHTYNDGDLIACFNENVPDSVVKEIARRQPLRVVFRDSSFANSPAKINVTEIFKLLAPDTRVKVI
ncbi:site-specific DNA-methyltransferase [Blautia obeum]|uniref:site-specific DNA-methyltransferase n=1 Tax=Blautia obeum TaxID=40520 RepID=UPI00156DBFEC|nr:site-specific DNA-methyltransferase [Blautia obeum]NSG38280.1 site-specific DNA-methyltransferase [Blautia obeum]